MWETQGMRDNPVAEASLSHTDEETTPAAQLNLTAELRGRGFWECSSPQPGCHNTQSFHTLVSIPANRLQRSVKAVTILELLGTSVASFAPLPQFLTLAPCY